MNMIAVFLFILIVPAITWIFPTLGYFINYLVAMGLMGLLLLTSYFIHRFWFARLLAKDGFRLVTFKHFAGFITWSTPPRWWEYRVMYLGTAAARSGDVADCSLSISGALFALIQPEIHVEVEMPSENEIWLEISIEVVKDGRLNDLFEPLECLEAEGLARFRCHRASMHRHEMFFALEPNADIEKALQIVIDGLKSIDCSHRATVKAIGFEHCDDKLTRYEKILWPLSDQASTCGG